MIILRYLTHLSQAILSRMSQSLKAEFTFVIEIWLARRSVNRLA